MLKSGIQIAYNSLFFKCFSEFVFGNRNDCGHLVFFVELDTICHRIDHPGVRGVVPIVEKSIEEICMLRLCLCVSDRFLCSKPFPLKTTEYNSMDCGKLELLRGYRRLLGIDIYFDKIGPCSPVSTPSMSYLVSVICDLAASVANEKVRKTRSIIAFDTNKSICSILHLSLTMLQSFVTVMSAFRREKHFVIFLSIFNIFSRY